MEKKFVEVSYSFALDEGFVEYPLLLSIDGPYLKVICKESQNILGEFKLNNLLTFKSRSYPWDYSNVYLKDNDKSDLEYCKSVIQSGFYNDELRLMISMPYVGDYRVYASFNTMDDPALESVLLEGSLENFNKGNYLDLDELKIGDSIPFPKAASVILNLVWYDEEGSAFPQNFSLEDVDVSIKVSDIAPELKGPESLPLNRLLQGRYFISLKNKYNTLLKSLEKRMRVSGLDQDPKTFLDLFYKTLNNGDLYVNPMFLEFPENVKKRLPQPK